MLNHVDLMAALTADYLNVYVVYPRSDRAEVIKLKGYVTEGITESEKSYEYSSLLSRYCQSRVYMKDRENFLLKLLPDALIRTFSDGRDSYECDYRITEDGIIHNYSAHYSRISKDGEELRLVAAFRNIDSIVSVGIEQRAMGLHNAYSALSGIFYSLHRVDIRNNSYIVIKNSPSIEKVPTSGTDNYDESSRRIISALSSDWSREEALRFVERSTLTERLKGKNHIMMDFISYAQEACRLHFFKEDEDEEGRAAHVIFGVEMLEDEKNRAVINILSRDYLNVFWINLLDGSARILKLTESVDDWIDVKENQMFHYDTVLSAYISSHVHPDDKAMLEDEISLSSLSGAFRNTDEVSGSYRTLRNGEEHHYRYTICSMPNLKSAVAAFSNIDDIILQHRREEEKQREKEEEYRRQREEQLAIFNSLARNFKNVYIVDLASATARVLKLEDDYSDNRLDGVIDREFPYEPFLNAWINEAVLSEDRKMLSSSLSVEHLKKVFLTSDEYNGNYRMFVRGKIIHYQYSISILQDRMHLIAGFQNVDAIIRSHLEEERKRQEKEEKYQAQLKEQLVIFDNLARNFRNVYLVDLDKESMKVLKLSDGYRKYLKVSRNDEFPIERVRRQWLDTIVVPEDRAEVEKVFDTENIKRLLRENGEFTGHYRSIHDGKMHHYQYSMSRVGNTGLKAVLGFQNVDDIVEEHLERERRERALVEAHMRDEREHAEVISAVSTIYSTIFRAELDTHRYEVLTSVPSMKAVAGKSGNFDDVREKILSSFVASDMRSLMSGFLNLETLEERLRDVNTISTEYRNPDGKWFESRFIVKKRDEEGRAREALYVAREITEEKMKEFDQQEKLSSALLAAQTASRAKSTFLNSMSHDIRTPMNAIIGFTALAQTHLDNPELVKDYLKKISLSSTHLLSLINDVLDMSRIESGTVKLEEKPVHIPALLHDLRTMIQGLVTERNLNLCIDTEDVVHENVVADRLRLNQVLINIVGNAIKYTPPGGDISVRLQERKAEKEGYATFVFSVRDTGIGMSPEFLKHIFESFSRERTSTVTGIQGTGLGMAITKNIVSMMGGTIEAESEEGKGSLFTVTLNLKLGDESVKTDPIEALIGSRALVVDDDVNTCRSVSRMLRDIQMRPDWTLSGREAVVRAEDAAESGDDYRVYIIDYLMPGMNGIETVRQIRRVIKEDVPIIVLTAYDWTDLETEAREAGVTAFVQKPIFMSELRSVLEERNGKEEEKKEENTQCRDYSGKRVLLVEDNDLNAEIATAVLENLGLAVDTASDGMEAVDIMYRADEDRYDIIFMDIQMPKMDGYTATHEIRTLANNRKANIPIVAMTANAFEEDRKKSLEAGMNGHIAKPISISDITAALDLVFSTAENEKSR